MLGRKLETVKRGAIGDNAGIGYDGGFLTLDVFLMSDRKRALLIDTSGFLHRNFHAMQPVLGQFDGHPVDVGALKGYMEYVAKQIYGRYSSINADLVIHALDSDGSDYRRQLHPGYKANRSAKHPALVAQESMTGRALRALGEHVAQRRGVEADDLAATLTRRLVAEGYLVCIATGDKDLMQLVKDGEVVVVRYEKGKGEKFNQHAFYEEAHVFEKLGVYPSQVAAFLAMQGDESDNIPGIANVGKVKAATLLQEFGSLESIVTRADEIKGKLGESVRAAKNDGSLDLCYRLTLPLDNLDLDHTAFFERSVINETEAAQWHQTLCLGSSFPLRLSDYDKAPGYVPQGAQPSSQGQTRAPAPATVAVSETVVRQVSDHQVTEVRTVSAVVAPAPSPVAAPTATPTAAPVVKVAPLDPFMDPNDDPFAERLGNPLDEPFVAPTPRTEEPPMPTPLRRFQRRTS